MIVKKTINLCGIENVCKENIKWETGRKEYRHPV